jgi:hypothetical protein
MKKIDLNGKGFALVDDEDYDFLMKWKWYISNGYAISCTNRQKMHRLLLGATPEWLVDHIDRDKLNNQRHNLRLVTKEENVHNQRKRVGTKNKYKGTHFIKRLGLWEARCRMYGNDFFLGNFVSEEAAAHAYNLKAAELSDTILLNEIDLPIEQLDLMLIEERRQIKPAERVSNNKGVYWHKKTGRMARGCWEAKVRIRGRYKSLGRYQDEWQASAAIAGALRVIKVLEG